MRISIMKKRRYGRDTFCRNVGNLAQKMKLIKDYL